MAKKTFSKPGIELQDPQYEVQPPEMPFVFDYFFEYIDKASFEQLFSFYSLIEHTNAVF